DQEGGSIVRLGTGTNTCGNMALGAAGDPRYAYENAEIIAGELKAVGINVDFAPVMDVNNDPRNPIINVRSFSSDPAIVCDMGTSFIEGLSDNGIIGSAKHFPGHGNTDTDSHTGLPMIDRSYEELKECELIPFQAAMDCGIDMIMTAHIQYPQIEKNTYKSISTGEEVYLPATLSKTILTDIVRGDMGYDGVIVTDGMQMAALKDNFDIYDTAELAINAGADILLEPLTTWCPDDIAAMEDYLDKLEEMVAEGRISESRVDESCTRILEMKYENGLFEKDDTDVETKVKNALATVGSKANHEKEAEITEKAITLIQNNNNVLPLTLEENESVAFFYPSDKCENSYVYAFDTLKNDGDIPESAVAHFNCYAEKSAADFSDIVEESKAVIISSESWNESYLDPTDAENGTQALFIGEMTELAHSLGKPVIVISTVLPYDLAAYTSADALIAAYSSKKMTVIPEDYNGELAAYGPNYPAAIRMVFGAFEPLGKLPVDIYAVDDDHKFTDEVLFPLGFGMSYGSSDDMTADEDTAEEDVAQPAEAEVSADETPSDATAANGDDTSVPSTGNIPVSAAAAAMVLGAAGAAAFKKRR
ncbi:MAG: glycoside hydrolase family 3 C-terminal domain-containing protein, partial [Oscillospiraceae bacterium]|nr:glycoside hydrolase family 3 C-terminal domain-containing protein [Oscillospiraceae bacterium]